MSREHEVRLPDRFWRHSTNLSLDAKGLYSILLTFIDYETCITFVSNRRLEREAGYGLVKVKELLKELESNGYIKRTQQKRGNLKSKRYIQCLMYASPVVQFRPTDPVVQFSVRPRISPLSLPSQSHPSPNLKKKNYVLALPFQNFQKGMNR